MRTTAALLLWAVSALAYAQVAVDAYVTGAYDGDTIYVDADIWPNLIWSGSVRVFGIDTPEIQGACEQERARAILARDYVRALLNEKTVRLSHIMNDKYGTRVLADVHLYDANLMEWQSLAVNLMVAGHARAYGGGERQGWCGDDLPVLRETGDSVSNDPLELYDDDGNGRISCTEASTHGIAPVYVGHPAYPYMDDRNNDGVVCE